MMNDSTETALDLSVDESTSTNSQASSNVFRTEFSVDFQRGEVSVLKGNTSHVRTDFAIKLLGMVEAGQLTGYQAKVTRQVDLKSRICYFTAEGIHNLTKFLSDINASFGSGGMSAWFKDRELPEFIHYLKKDVVLPVKKAATILGKQQDDDVWVISPTLQLNISGEPFISEDAPYVWIPPEILCDSKVKNRLLSMDLCPTIVSPFPRNCLVLLNMLINLLETCSKHNFLPSLLTLGAAVQAFHYEAIIELFGGCPVTILRGPPETGKSKALTSAMAMVGCNLSAYFVKGTNAFFIGRASETTLPFIIDDPQLGGSRGSSRANQLDLQELIVDLYNGAKTANAVRGSRTPRSCPLIATNYNLQADSRCTSRANIIPFKAPAVGPITPAEQKAYTELTNAIQNYKFSPCIAWVIRQISELKDDIIDDDGDFSVLRSSMETVFSGAPRLQIGWAGALYFTKKLLSTCGRESLYASVETLLSETVVKEYQFVIENQTVNEVGEKSFSINEHVLDTTLDELFKIADTMSTKERLTFMRDDTSIKGKPVLVVNLGKVSDSFTYSQEEINQALKDNPAIGIPTSAGYIREFLTTSSPDTVIRRGSKHCIRSRVAAFYVSSLPKSKTKLTAPPDPSTEPDCPTAPQDDEPHHSEDTQNALTIINPDFSSQKTDIPMDQQSGSLPTPPKQKKNPPDTSTEPVPDHSIDLVEDETHHSMNPQDDELHHSTDLQNTSTLQSTDVQTKIPDVPMDKQSESLPTPPKQKKSRKRFKTSARLLDELTEFYKPKALKRRK